VVLAQGDDIVPIPGTKRIKYLQENAAAVDITLRPAELNEIAAIFPADAVAGDRYPQAMMTSLNG
jgi:aryl-alcohol dehydrogenase-like predicted oxidoreductase